jgi:signal peptidase II
VIKSLIVFTLAFIGIFVIDQNIKSIFLNGYRWEGDFFSLILTFNKGVAFSMLSFLEGNLKYIQGALILAAFFYLVWNKEIFKTYCLPAGIILGAGSSNLYDRFIHNGVVDYFFWHHWFNFAVFNFADAMIDVSVAIILFISYRKSKISKKEKPSEI